MSTLSIVRAALVQEYSEASVHNLRVLEINGLIPKSVLMAHNAGFCLWVRGGIVSEFAHAAAIGSSDSDVREDYKRAEIIYVGDMPDFAVERIHSAKRFSRWLTIHSNEALTVKRLQRVPDPVILAWVTPIGTLHVDRRVVEATYPEALGFVVAMWDMDKELFLKP